MTAPFDAIAAKYDELWTNTSTGRSQRDAVWREIDPLFRPGERIVDLGCGTGEDALHLMQAGVSVLAFDASPEMVRIARARGVDARILDVAQALRPAAPEFMPAHFGCDGILSNFGALNCVRDISSLSAPLARLIRPGGHLALCTIGRFCLAETLRFIRTGRFRKATRRWSGESHSQSLNLRVFYPTIRQLTRAFATEFKLLRAIGVGMCPQSLAHLPFFRALTDHRLLIFVRHS
jgi:ubiquinone/menaquinone biosynthesis C-methylase UbiE